MNKFLEVKSPEKKILRQQYQKARVENRWFSGVGFFTTFSVPEGVARLSTRSTYITDVRGKVNDTAVGFMLHIKDGILKFLEGYTYDDPWPDKIINYKLWYTNYDQQKK
ncbi:hypothetical protein E3J79_00615 [Candidatus Dependentiae bacterium]|nr:MAG: hypothetical protein E3J79_00615 [Candidatus Dependentiae bacterium]